MTQDDISKSEREFYEIHTEHPDSFTFSPLCPNIQAKIHTMLLEMTEEGSAAYQLVYSVGPGNGSQAWALLRQEFSQQRPTEQMMVLTQFSKPVRQKPGESVTQYMLNVQKRFGRLEQLAEPILGKSFTETSKCRPKMYNVPP